MNKLDLIFEELIFSRNKNLNVICTATMKYPKIRQKTDVIAVSMATMTFQYGAYLSFKLMYRENKFSDPHFFILENISLKYNKQSDQF